MREEQTPPSQASPPAPGTLEEWLALAGGAKALRLAATITLAGTLVFLVLIPDLSGPGDRRLVGSAFLIPLSLATLLLHWRGKTVAAYYTLLWGTLVAVTVSSLLNAGLRSAILFAYPSVIMGAMALGPRTVVRVGAASIACVIVLALAEHLGLTNPSRAVPTYLFALILVLVLVIMTIIAAAMVREQMRWREKEARATLAERQSLLALAQRENDLRLIMDNVPALICAFDGMTCRFANPRYAQYFGLSQTEIVGRHLRDIIGEEAFAHAAPLVQRTLAGETVTYRGRRFSPAFGERILQISLVPGTADADGTRGFFGLMLDVTEQEQAHQEVERLNRDLDQRVRERTAELAAANRELESFAYSISHDLRAPLRGIDGFSQMALEEYGDKLEAQGRGYLERVRAAAQRMGTLIDDILELSRVSRHAMRQERVDLSRLAQELTDEFRQTDLLRNVEVSIAPGCAAQGDPRLLRVLMQNLIENAWKYTSRQAEARIDFGAELLETGETAWFVRDDGIGFDMKYADRLFSPFQRMHGPEEYPGSGIGLASVARVVHRHGGRVWVESAPGRGTTVRFTLANRARE